MESCWTVAVSSELAYTFPTLVDLSAKQIVAIWDAVSDFILEKMKLNKGVVVPGLGIFAAVQEEFHSKELAVPVRRPVFELDIGVIWLKELQSPNDIIPDDVKIEPLNYRQLGGAIGISMHRVKRCVQETVLLYWHLLKSKADVSFFFKNIGVMTCRDNFLCMRFFHSCIETLESKSSIIAMLHSRTWPKHYADVGPETIADGIHMFPRFQLTVKMSREEAAAYGARKMSRVGPGGRLLRRQKSVLPPMLLFFESDSRQQDVAKKPSASVLPPCAGSSRGTKKAGQKEALTAAQTRDALPATDDNKRVLQELREASASRITEDSMRRLRPVYRKEIEKERAKRAACDVWSAEKDQHTQQSFCQGKRACSASSSPAQGTTSEQEVEEGCGSCARR
uniref:Coiled-coil domain-containing protein 81-like n=1 Tax=Coturnix japonica TaxID=93934 RepID=A0A8C2YA24_COTJA